MNDLDNSRTGKRRDSVLFHDDEQGLYRATRTHSKGSGRQVREVGPREVDRDGCARKSKHKKVIVIEESDSGRAHGGQRRRRDNDERRRRSSEALIQENERQRSPPQLQKRHGKARNKTAAESTRRHADDSRNAARSDYRHADGYSDQTSDSSPTCAGGRGGLRRRANSGEKRHGSAEAQGSETTATPSPRDPSGGSFGEMVVDSTNQRGLAWAAGPVGTAGASSWVGSRREKVRLWNRFVLVSVIVLGMLGCRSS